MEQIKVYAFGMYEGADDMLMEFESGQSMSSCTRERPIREKGISRQEYSERGFCAGISGDFEMENYKKYSVAARELARRLGVLKEKGGDGCCD